MKIVIADIDKDALKTVSEELKEIRTEVLSLTIDVGDPDQVARLADASYDHFGSVNILCNNAGVSTYGPMQLLTLKDWNWVLGANLFGVIYGIKYFLGHMLNIKEPCHIINTASIAGLIASDSGPYTASKFAVVGISERLKQQCFNTNVSVSVLCPGYVVTDIIKKMENYKQTETGIYKQTPEREAMTKPFMDIVETLFYSGMDSDMAAEMVIKAIEEDIFYILTHPEFLPNIKDRFDRMESDTIKLTECLGKSLECLEVLNENDLTTKTYKHKSPAFSISYPKDWTQVTPVPTPVLKQVFLALAVPNYGLSISTSRKSTGMVLENTSKKLIRYLNTIAKDIRLISSQQTKLRDGTPAYETVIEYLRMGVQKSKILCITVFSDDKVIRVIVSSGAYCYSDDLKKIAYSLELK